MSRLTLASLAGAVLALLVTGAPAAAQTNIYWNGTGTTWNSTSDWWTTPGGATPVGSFSGSSIIANFNATSVTSPQALTLDANQVIQGLVFTGTDVGGETISSGAGTNSLTIGASGIVDNFGSGVDTIAANLVLSSSQSWSNYSANTLTVSGNISQSGPGLGLTFAGAGTVALAGSNTYSGPTVLANGLGTLLLDFTAATAPADNIINNGVTITNNNITSGSGLVLGGGTLRINVSLSSANNQAFNGTTVNAGQSMLTFTNTGAGSVNLAFGRDHPKHWQRSEFQPVRRLYQQFLHDDGKPDIQRRFEHDLGRLGRLYPSLEHSSQHMGDERRRWDERRTDHRFRELYDRRWHNAVHCRRRYR